MKFTLKLSKPRNDRFPTMLPNKIHTKAVNTHITGWSFCRISEDVLMYWKKRWISMSDLFFHVQKVTFNQRFVALQMPLSETAPREDPSDSEDRMRWSKSGDDFFAL